MKAVLSTLVVLTSSILANAHFQMAFPQPRGPFVEPAEVGFCDGFTNVTTNRTDFPLSGGIVTLNSEHPSWTAAFFVSTVPNPNNFNNFSQVNSFFQLTGEGGFCLPLDLASSNATGLHDGQNVTIQMIFNGGDGNLFQCSDVTLRSSVNISSVPCTNSTNSTGSGNSTGSSSGSGALGSAASFDMKLLGLLGVASLIPLVL